MPPDEANGDAPYRRPRIVVGVGLSLLVFVLFLVGRPPDPISLGLLLGCSLLFLGVEGAKMLFRG